MAKGVVGLKKKNTPIIKNSVLIISPGLEDGGLRGIGRVMIALVNSLPELGYNTFVLTGAPVTFRNDNQLCEITNRRMVDHYLEEGIKSSAFRLGKFRVFLGITIDVLRLLFGTSTKISSKHQLPAQHTPLTLREYEKAQGYINFIFYTRSRHGCQLDFGLFLLP